MLVSQLRQPRRGRRRGRTEKENEKRREIPEVDYDVKAYEGERERERDRWWYKERDEGISSRIDGPEETRCVRGVGWRVFSPGEQGLVVERCRGSASKEPRERSAPFPAPSLPPPFLPECLFSSVTPTIPLIRLCLPLARWHEEILEMRDSFIKGEKRCQRARDTTESVALITRIIVTPRTRPARLYPSVCLSLLLSFFLSRVSLSYDTLSWTISARGKYARSDRATHFVLDCILHKLRHRTSLEL